MEQKDKDLVLKDLCARLPYEIKVKVPDTISINVLKIYTIEQMYKSTFYCKRGEWICKFWNDTFSRIDEVKPYLRPMNSMTDIEGQIYETLLGGFATKHAVQLIDWLNRKMFDYRGLIPLGLALKASKDMYKEE